MKRVLAAIFWAVWAFLFFTPFPRTASAGGDSYLCRWEDGAQTRESFSSALASFAAAEEAGIVLVRSGIKGTIEGGAAYRAAVVRFDGASLPELLAFQAEGLDRLERAAFYLRAAERIWFDGKEWYVWTGEGLARSDARPAGELCVWGDLSASALSRTGATVLRLLPGAELHGASLAGSNVSRVIASAPYGVSDGCVLLDTAGGKRLLSGIPKAERVAVPGDVSFADEGALLACEALKELDLPFVGNAASGVGTSFRGEFAFLFSTGTEYRVPATLERVRVRGGTLVSRAFYGCGLLREIDACGTDPSRIAADAFADCAGLRLLHTPRADVLLPGTFSAQTLPCGCTLYTALPPSTDLYEENA